MIGPTPRQLDVVEAIRVLTEREGIPPTIREIGQFVGIRSTNCVHQHLDSLRRKGLVTWDTVSTYGGGPKARTLRLVTVPVVVVPEPPKRRIHRINPANFFRVARCELCDRDTLTHDSECSSCGARMRGAA